MGPQPQKSRLSTASSPVDTFARDAANQLKASKKQAAKVAASKDKAFTTAFPELQLLDSGAGMGKRSQASQARPQRQRRPIDRLDPWT